MFSCKKGEANFKNRSERKFWNPGIRMTSWRENLKGRRWGDSSQGLQYKQIRNAEVLEEHMHETMQFEKIA